MITLNSNAAIIDITSWQFINLDITLNSSACIAFGQFQFRGNMEVKFYNSSLSFDEGTWMQRQSALVAVGLLPTNAEKSNVVTLISSAFNRLAYLFYDMNIPFIVDIDNCVFNRVFYVIAGYCSLLRISNSNFINVGTITESKVAQIENSVFTLTDAKFITACSIGCAFLHYNGENTTIQNVSFSSNVLVDDYTIFYSNGGSLHLDNVVINGFRCLAAIFFPSTILIQNSLIRNSKDSALLLENADYFENSTLMIEFFNTSFQENSNLTIYQSANDMLQAELTLVLCSFKNNSDLHLRETKLLKVRIEQSVFKSNVNSLKNMIDVFQSYSESVINSRFISNICSFCSLLSIRYNNFQVASSIIFNSATLFNVTFENCISYGFGSPVSVGVNAKAVLKLVRFSQCSSIVGGCLYIPVNAHAIVEDSNFSDCFASGSAGGSIFLGSQGNLTVTSSRFLSSSTSILGGSIFADRLSMFSISQSAFNNSISGLNGGAIFMSEQSIGRLTDSLFTESISVKGSAIYALFGAILSVNRSNFYANIADESGGAIFVHSNASVFCFFTRFEENRAVSGGALYLDEGSLVDVRNCSFSSNRAILFGGAVIAEMNSLLFIANSWFFRNLAQSGGALFLKEAFSFSSQNSSFQSNEALITAKSCDELSGCGGAIYFSGFDSVFKCFCFEFCGSVWRCFGAFLPKFK
jgi:hypothetical protein